MQKSNNGSIPEWSLSFFGEGLFAPCYALQWGGFIVLLPMNDDVDLRIYSKVENYLNLMGSLASKFEMDAGVFKEIKDSFVDKLVPNAKIELNNPTLGQPITVFGGIHNSAKSVITDETRVMNWKEVKNKKIRNKT